MARVLEVARHELNEVGAVQFNILRVIENAGVSRSSVYHHFGGRDGVIAAVEVQRLVGEMRSLNDAIRDLVSTANSASEVLGVIKAVLTDASSPDGRKQRAHRIGVMAAAQNIKVLAETLTDEQTRGDEHLAETLRLASERGLIRGVSNPLGVAHFISSLFIGRTIVDVMDDDEADNDWIDTTMDVLDYLLTGSR